MATIAMAAARSNSVTADSAARATASAAGLQKTVSVRKAFRGVLKEFVRVDQSAVDPNVGRDGACLHVAPADDSLHDNS